MPVTRTMITVLALGLLSSTAEAGNRGHGGAGWGHRSHVGGDWRYRGHTRRFHAPVVHKRVLEPRDLPRAVEVSRPAPAQRMVVPVAPVIRPAAIPAAVTSAKPVIAPGLSPLATLAPSAGETTPPQAVDPVAPALAISDTLAEVMPEAAVAVNVADERAPEATTTAPGRPSLLSPTASYAPPLPAPQLPRPLR